MQIVCTNHPRRLWYRQSAADWNEALPLGSGTLGMMVFGGREREELQLNEESLWSGYAAAWDDPACREHLPEIRELLGRRKLREAEALCKRYLVCRGHGTDDPYYGSYQTAGSLLIDAPAADAGDYIRLLDLDRGAAETRFGPVRRVHTVSHRYQVTASRLTGCERYALSFSRENCTVRCQGRELLAAGRNEGAGALAFCTLIRIETDGAVAAEGQALTVTGGSRLVIWTCTATSYDMEETPEAVCRRRIDAAQAAGFDAVLADEAAWMSEAMGRCTLELSSDPALEALPTDLRLERVRQGERDAGLCRLLFDYSRYLLICSAWGRLPANLQGVWSKDIATPWTGDYHININLQMNYWFVDAAGLDEYGESLYRYLAFLADHGRDTARIMYGLDGWVAHTATNPWGFTAPGQDPDWGSFHCAGAWCCRHLYEHYLYTGDLAFLRRYWPVIEGSVRFFTSFLMEDPVTGYLVTAPSNSPENSYINPEDGERVAVALGPTMDSMILRELFETALDCARLLELDWELSDTVQDILRRLPPTRISAYGTIQEWLEDYPEWEPGHRHVSQLYGLYPGRQVSPAATPELARAARKTLERRLSHGGGHTGWSRAWIINFFARLWDGPAAEEHLYALLAKSTLPNLFDTHPPFQIDGNFGAAAGILEMLVQSHDGVIRLLPALPPSWRDGCLKDIRLRGGCRVSFRWEEGRVVEGILTARYDGTARVLINGREAVLTLKAGQRYPLPV